MRAQRPVLALLGGTSRSAIVAGLGILSLLVYLASSRAAAQLWSGWGYLQSVITGLIGEPHARVFAFPVALSGVALITTLVFTASCVAMGVLVARGMRGHPGATAMGWAVGLAATVVPTLLVALVRWPDGGDGITNGALCLAQLPFIGATWLWAQLQPRETVADAEVAQASWVPATWWGWVAWSAGLLFALTVLLNGLSGLKGYDTFSNHLAVPAQWLVRGRLTRGLPGEIVSYYPGNFELLVRWALSLGTDRFAFLLSFASSALAVWLVWRIARTIGQSRQAAGFAALGAGTLQVMAYQSVVVYSDTFTTCGLLLATWLLLLWVDDDAQDVRLSVGFGLALGLALGAKYSAGPPAVILGVIWLWTAWRDTTTTSAHGIETGATHVLVRHLAGFTAAVLLTMGYWYVRNAVEMHNPLYPLSVMGLPGIPITDLLAGAPGPRTAWERLTYPWVETGHGPGFETGLSPLFAAAGVLGVIAAPFGGRLRERLPRLAWIILLGAGIAWLRTGVLVPRYGLFPLLLACVFIGELWMAFASPVLHAVIGGSSLLTMLAMGHEMLGGMAYAEVMYTPGPAIPAAIGTLPPSRILNVAGEPAGYYAMDRGYRHRVISLFSYVTPETVRLVDPEYLLLPSAREAEFTGAMRLTLVDRWTPPGSTAGTSLWRVRP